MNSAEWWNSDEPLGMGSLCSLCRLGCFLVASVPLEIPKMNAWPSLLFGHRDPQNARFSDPETSHEAAARLSTKQSHCAILLGIYANQPYSQRSHGLTDDEAGELSGLENGAWKRCSDLRGQGFIKPVAKRLNKKTGRRVQACSITIAGDASISLRLCR
jgi:hypothetical protein